MFVLRVPCSFRIRCTSFLFLLFGLSWPCKEMALLNEPWLVIRMARFTKSPMILALSVVLYQKHMRNVLSKSAKA